MNHREIRNLVLGTIIGASGLTAFAAFSEFQAGTPIKAADVNAKFNDLDTRVTAKQARVTGTCAAGSSISAIAADGTVTCEADDVGTGGSSFTTGAGLSLSAGVLSLADSGVTRAKLDVAGSAAAGKLLRASAAGLEWADDGLKLPFNGAIGAADAGSIGVNVTSNDPSKTAIKGLGGNFGVVGDTLSPTGVGVLAANSGAAGGAALEISGGIKVSGASKPAFIHVTTAANKPILSDNVTCIDNVLTNGKPNAIVIITQNWGAGFTFNNSSVGVYYKTTGALSNQWCIFNQGMNAMPINATFNVLVFNQ